MHEMTLRATDLMLLVGTRVALGVGVGLLAAGRMDEEFRRGAGKALVVVGALTTIPFALNAWFSREEGKTAGERPRAAHRAARQGSERRQAGALEGDPAAY
jgi:hypothetical protein